MSELRSENGENLLRAANSLLSKEDSITPTVIRKKLEEMRSAPIFAVSDE